MPERRKCGVCQFSQNRLPWQRPLRYRKRGPDGSSAPKSFHSIKRLRKSVQDIRRYLTKYAKPDVNTQHNFHLLSCFPRKLWTDLHQNFTLYSGSSDAIKSCIYRALVHSFRFRTPEQRVKVVDFDVVKMLQN